MPESTRSEPLLPEVDRLIARLEATVEPLRTCRDLSGKLRDEVAQLVASIEAPRKAARNIKSLDTMIGTIAKVCQFLSVFPVVGGFANTINKILGTIIQPPLDAVARALGEADKHLMKPVDDELARLRPVFEALEEALHQLADVVDELLTTLRVVNAVADVLWGLSVISGNQKARAEVEKMLKGYNDTARAVLDAADDFGRHLGSFHGAADLARKVVPPVTGFLTSAADIVFKPVNAVLNHLSGLKGICETARNWLKPFEWVLKCAAKIIEWTIGWLIDKILDVLGLRKLVNALKDALLRLLGIDRIKAFAADIAAKFGDLTPDVFANIADPRQKMVEVKEKIYAETRGFASAKVQEELRALTRMLLEDGGGKAIA
ncbi:MAG: hypothetical protein OEM24_01765 [Paracoccaceae bacterium]|nr:hypothetical protein [Paracoccaceae bacterium]